MSEDVLDFSYLLTKFLLEILTQKFTEVNYLPVILEQF